VSDAALGRRVLREHRRLVVPLGIALVLNVITFAFLVYPLSQRVANIAQRDAAAERTLLAARQEHTRVPQIARRYNVEFFSSTTARPSKARDSTLARYTSNVELAGRYRDIRSFIHELETAPEFVVIDDVSLASDDDEGGFLQLTLTLSTYYQAAE
jgi:hypothetical protein